ncbi:MAG: hypothetical protein NVSMB22_28280 [Chloroflexota bacterium]
MSLTSLQQLQARFSHHIDSELRMALDSMKTARTFWGMMEYHLGFRDQMLARVHTGGGKRFRPALCLLACEAVDGAWTDALRLAAAIELLHNFSLIHDDIEDGDSMRHHRPTVWRVWGEPQGINVGDGMFALASRLAVTSTREPALSLAISTAFHDTALALTEGQFMDMSFESRMDVSSEEYMHMISLKTAALVSFSLWSGATLGDAESLAGRHLREYGRHLGLAFQIHDDFMGVWGQPEQTGKEVAQDLRKRKKTLPVLLALERANREQRTELERFLEREDDDLAVPLTIMAEIDVAQYVEHAINAQVLSALAALEQARVGEAQRRLLTALAYELTGQRFESSAGTVSNV